MADSPDKGQLNTQKRTHFTNGMKKAYPTNRKSIGVPLKKHTPHYWVCLLGALRGMLRGYASGVIQYNCTHAEKHTQRIPKAYPKAYPLNPDWVQPPFRKREIAIRTQGVSIPLSIPLRNTHARGYVFLRGTPMFFRTVGYAFFSFPLRNHFRIYYLGIRHIYIYIY